jgi:murein DD-endopeptidase MepM/ murein hydrolase activator NlpD
MQSIIYLTNSSYNAKVKRNCQKILEEKAVSPAHRYKKIESQLFNIVIKAIKQFFSMIITLFKLFIRKGRQRFTVMFIPHSEKKIFNFHISVFSLVFFICLVVVLVIAFFGLSTHFTTANKRILKAEENLKNTETNLDKIKDEIHQLGKAWKDFKAKMDSLYAILGTKEAAAYNSQGVGGDFSLLNIENVDDISLHEEREIRNLRNFLSNATGPIGDVAELLKSQKELLMDIPTLWPIKARGNITAGFGVEVNPFTHGFRLHRGVDIAWSYNTPIVATANGKVQNIDFIPTGLGHCVTISHKYGFTTVYGHMSRSIVYRGQEVVRGQIIGYVGSTGLSTGPHCHYEVHMGTQVVDPISFLDIKSPLVDSYAQN